MEWYYIVLIIILTLIIIGGIFVRICRTKDVHWLTDKWEYNHINGKDDDFWSWLAFGKTGTWKEKTLPSLIISIIGICLLIGLIVFLIIK